MLKIIRKITSKILLSLIDPKSLAQIVAKVNQENLEKEYDKKYILGDQSKIFFKKEIINFRNKEDIFIGANTHIKGQLFVKKYGGKIKIGDYTFVGEGSKIWSGDSITIGSNVLISHDVNIIDSDSHEINAIERSERYKELIQNGFWDTKGSIVTSPIVIADYAWISFGASILKGVTIGEGAIVGAGSVVTKNVEPYTLVAGNPAKFIKKLEK